MILVAMSVILFVLVGHRTTHFVKCGHHLTFLYFLIRAEDLEQQQQQQQRGAAAAELVTMETAPSDEAAATAAKPEDDDLTLGAEGDLSIRLRSNGIFMNINIY